jgi:tetratricopeptide (TPR) repeat protein/predicted aspartyl protease
MKTHVLACSLFVATIHCTSALAGNKCKLDRFAELPITMSGPRALTVAKFNGQETRLFIDSGAFYSILSPAVAATFNLKLSPLPFGLSVRGLGGSTADVQHTIVKTFTLAGFDLHNVDFLVGGTEVSTGGVLGRNILHLGDVEYDFAQGFVRLFAPKDCQNTALAYWGSYSEMPITAEINIKLPTGTSIQPRTAPWMYTNIGTVSVNGREFHVELDTGSPVSFLSLKAAEKVGIKPDSPGVLYAGDYVGVGTGRYRTYIARFDSFKIGQEQIKNAKLRIGDLEIPNVDMLLGADFVLSHRIYVSNSQHKMYFSYNGGPVFDLTVKPKSGAEPATQTAAASQPGGESGEAAATAVPAGDAADFARRGEAMESRREFAQALEQLTRACELEPDNPEYLFRRGVLYEELQQAASAMADFDRSLQLRPNDLNALLTRAELKIRTGDKPGGRADLDAAGAVAPKQAGARFRIARAYERVDQLDETVKQISLWIESHEDDAELPEALNTRCRARALQGVDLPLALKDCTSALRHLDKSAAVYPRVADSRGLVYLRMGDFDKSIADYDTAVRLNPKDAWAWYGRGIDKLRKSKTQDGNADIAAAVALWPGVAAEFKRRGIVSD